MLYKVQSCLRTHLAEAHAVAALADDHVRICLGIGMGALQKINIHAVDLQLQSAQLKIGQDQHLPVLLRQPLHAKIDGFVALPQGSDGGRIGRGEHMLHILQWHFPLMAAQIVHCLVMGGFIQPGAKLLRAAKMTPACQQRRKSIHHSILRRGGTYRKNQTKQRQQ